MPQLTPRGPARWERARLNAGNRPSSASAKLYLSRLGVAHEVARVLVGHEGVPADTVYATDFAERTFPGGDWDWARKYYTCSVQHAALQATLDFGDGAQNNVPQPDRLAQVLRGESSTVYRRVVQARPTRNARCQVCAATITPQPTLLGVVAPPTWHGLGVQLESAGIISNGEVTMVVEPPATRTVLVDGDGVLRLPDNLLVLEVTDREYDLLVHGTNDGRRVFANKYGRELEL